MVKVKTINNEKSFINKPMSITKKILNEFSKKSTIKLSDLYSILSQDVELEHIPHLKHRISYFLSLKIGLSKILH